MQNLDTLALVLTTKCSRRCPECFCHDSLGTWEADFDKLLHSVEVMAPNRVHLTGGEPTLYTRIGDLIRELRSKVPVLTLESNAMGVLFEELRLLDGVYISRYPDNANGVSNLVDYLGEAISINIGNVHHIPRNRRNKGTCPRQYASVSLYKDRVYPCCVSWSIPGAASIEPCGNWREEIKQIPCPCDQCCFATGRPA